MTSTVRWSPLLERALRVAARAHHHQNRKGGTIPYITHPVGVAWVLMRAGFQDDTLLAAALLHDVLEDTSVTAAELSGQFPPAVLELVNALSETKTDASGQQRPWRVRKVEHLEQVRSASLAARTLTLADKLHNLETMLFDLALGVDVWSLFNAPRADVLWYHREMLRACDHGEAELQPLVAAIREIHQNLDCQTDSTPGSVQ